MGRMIETLGDAHDQQELDAEDAQWAHDMEEMHQQEKEERLRDKRWWEEQDRDEQFIKQQG